MFIKIRRDFVCGLGEDFVCGLGEDMDGLKLNASAPRWFVPKSGL
jgi:hypothetical protein